MQYLYFNLQNELLYYSLHKKVQQSARFFYVAEDSIKPSLFILKLIVTIECTSIMIN